MEDYCIRLIKEMIAVYKTKLDNADIEERLIYSIVIDDLKGLLVDLIHH
jgi:hypothetical protein